MEKLELDILEMLYKKQEYSDRDLQNLSEECDLIMEKLITFGGKAYPKFGNIVILAGGAGSGKGFVKDKLVGIEGKTFDVDELKTLATKTPKIVQRVKDAFGVSLPDLVANGGLKDPDNVRILHEIIGDELKLPDKLQRTFFASVLTADPSRKPNIIFDVTLKSIDKLWKITSAADSLGYPKENIHIVWIVNDIEVAKKQNMERDRTVPVEILVNTHRGASQTMSDIINLGKSLKRYMDGDIVFAFNKIGVDTDLASFNKKDATKNTVTYKQKEYKLSNHGGSFIVDSNYFYVKRKGKPSSSVKELSREIKMKIQQYVPKNVEWE